MTITIKICGVKTPEAIEAAVTGGVGFLGFNFFKPSPRYVTLEMAGTLAKLVPPHVKKVALVVDADDETLRGILKHLPADMLQLHGHETPQRVAEVKKLFGLPIIKAMPVETSEDIEKAAAYEDADTFLFDAKPPKDSILPGGNAVSFDWTLLKDTKLPKPWFLAGGLNADNIKTAISQSGARLLDISSGVEQPRGEKSPELIGALLTRVKTL